ncbi:MAG: SprT family zinc-dependent metalloprotease [Acidimicrobiia bacterium]|nr:SprT family zinc-dependent metalloprotease [Acidimicrobiia bacterium]
MTDRVLEVAGLEVAVSERPARSTMEITIDRDGSLLVAVPAGTPDDPVRDFIDRKQDWIHRKLIEKADFLPVQPPKQLVNGEGFRYLGRNYRLLLVDDQDMAVRLSGGRLCLRRDEPDGAAALIAWYRATGTSWLRKRVRLWASRCNVPEFAIVMRDLGYRWGSYRDGRLNIHWATLQLQPTLVDYVLVHELTHAHYPNHSNRFWDAVARVQPVYAESRDRLAAAGRTLWLGDVASG